MNQFWALAASPAAQLAAAFLCAVLVWKFSSHLDGNGKLDTPKIALAFGLGGSIYTWLLCIFGQLVMRGNPTVSTLVASGFGDDRIAWLLVIVAADGVLRLMKTYLD